METVSKHPQEIAVQAIDAYPTYSALDLPDADVLQELANGLKQSLKDTRPYTQTDERLSAQLDDMYKVAVDSGVWKPDQGDGAEARLQYGVEKFRGYGARDEQAETYARDNLKRSGYVNAIRFSRDQKEREFRKPLVDYMERHKLAPEEEEAAQKALLERTMDIATLTEHERAVLSEAFPSGNFLYHGSGTEQIIQILDSGAIMNTGAMFEREKQAAEAEGREVVYPKRNSGYEGISWSMNGIDALPGARYHLAGFVAAPESVLTENQQLAVPSRPSPNEAIQLSGEMDANAFYVAKTQYELYRQAGMMGEANSVQGNLIAVKMWADVKNHDFMDEPLLYKAKRELLSQEEYQAKLRELYEAQEDGSVRLSPDLLQQVDNEVPVAAVWLQAMIDTGRINQTTSFADKGVAEIIDAINDDNINELYGLAASDIKPLNSTLEAAEATLGDIAVPVEGMYFMAPRKDAGLWLKILAGMQHKPAGILLYDGKKVRLENFAGLHKGDQSALTEELKSAISPGAGYLEYSEVLGVDINDDMRAGYRHQVIAEKYLDRRRVVRKDAAGELQLT